MRDVVPPNDRSIRNIPVPAHRKRAPHEEIEQYIPEVDDGERVGIDIDPSPRSRRPSRGRLVLWVGAAGLVGVLMAVLLSYFFAGATVTVTPKREVAPAATALTAKLDAPLGTLPYQTITQSITGSRTVPTSGEATVSRRASGTITISNTYSTSAQRLIKNTRFEAANGKIYRIDASVDVPGAKKQADGTLMAGTATTQVFADSPGAEYNQGPTTFTIPGFKGDPRYSKFSARSTTPIKDGFVGTEKVVSDADLKAARAAIESELSGKITETLKQNLPDGFMYVEGSVRIATEDMPRGTDGSGGAIISIRGTGTAAIVKADYLASALLKASSKDYAGEAVYFSDPKTVALTSASPLSEDLRGDLSVSISAPVDIVWQFDQSALTTALVGAPASKLQSIMQQFKPAVDQATVSLRPVWTSSFPKDPSKIKLVVKK